MLTIKFHFVKKIKPYLLECHKVSHNGWCPLLQRSTDKFIGNNNLDNTFAYLDNLTICGTDQNKQDKNLNRFTEAAERNNLKCNKDKFISSAGKIQLLCYEISHNEIKPVPSRFQPLRDLPPHGREKSCCS